MSERVCQTCSGPLPPTKPLPQGGGRARKFCSERCRKAQYAGQCIDCGAPTNGYDGPGKASERCATCAKDFYGERNSQRYAERYKAQRDELANLYLSGASYREIADHYGWKDPQQVSSQLARLRRYGYDLPHRYPAARREHMREARWGEAA